MKRKSVGVVSALSMIFIQAGLDPSALAQEAEDLELRCAYYRDLGSKEELQRELESLLETDPDDQCIPLIVGLLGPVPVAVVTDPPIGDPDTPDGPGGVAPTSY